MTNETKATIKTRTKYEIRTDAVDGPLWGHSYDRDRAIARAEKLTKKIRTDVPVVVVANGEIVSTSGTTTLPGGLMKRKVVSV